MKNEKTFFCRQFKNIMHEKNITQQELAGKLGIAQSMISQWLTGVSNPSLNSLKKLSAALEVPLSYFLENMGNSLSDDIRKIEKDYDKKDFEILKLKNKILSLEKENLELKLKLKDYEQAEK